MSISSNGRKWHLLVLGARKAWCNILATFHLMRYQTAQWEKKSKEPLTFSWNLGNLTSTSFLLIRNILLFLPAKSLNFGWPCSRSQMLFRKYIIWNSGVRMAPPGAIMGKALHISHNLYVC